MKVQYDKALEIDAVMYSKQIEEERFVRSALLFLFDIDYKGPLKGRKKSAKRKADSSLAGTNPKKGKVVKTTELVNDGD
jgi:hypothetical protein